MKEKNREIIFVVLVGVVVKMKCNSHYTIDLNEKLTWESRFFFSEINYYAIIFRLLSGEKKSSVNKHVSCSVEHFDK